MPLLILAFAPVPARAWAGRPGTARTYASLVIMVSGAENLAFQLLNGRGIADVWDWADHIRVRIGHYPTRNEAFAFIAVHLTLAAAILLVPTNRLQRTMGRSGTTAEPARTPH